MVAVLEALGRSGHGGLGFGSGLRLQGRFCESSRARWDFRREKEIRVQGFGCKDGRVTRRFGWTQEGSYKLTF